MDEEAHANISRPCPFRDFKSLIKHGLNDDKTPTASSVEQVSTLILIYKKQCELVTSRPFLNFDSHFLSVSYF